MNNLYYTLYQMVEQVIEIIRRESREIIATEKPAYPGKDKDFFTNADIAAQAYYAEKLQNSFPGCGILGEESDLRIAPADENGITFILDPLDGTKNYNRGDSHGVGTMVAAVKCNEVIAALVGNVNTGEIVGFGPGMKPRQQRFGHTVTLRQKPKFILAEAYMLLDKAPWNYPQRMQQMIKPMDQNGLVRSVRIMGGSIGTTMACLWTGAVEAVALEPALAPWDHAPLLGMNNTLGLIHLRLLDDGKLEQYQPEIFYDLRPLPHRMEIVTWPEHAEAILKYYNE